MSLSKRISSFFSGRSRRKVHEPSETEPEPGLGAADTHPAPPPATASAPVEVGDDPDGGADGFRRARVGSLAELAGGIAHEINNPLAIMVEEAGWMEDLLEEEAFQQSENLDEFRRALRQIKTQGARCKEITHNLLSFARKTDPKVKEVQLNDLIREVVQVSAARISHPGIRLETRLADRLPPIRVSPSEMQQIFTNLVNNALDALDWRGGTVTVATRLEGEEIVAEVSDTGQGIPEANLSRIFDPFFTTKPVGKGTGLGLSICYGIINRLGGEISVKSSVGAGTTFRIRIPLREGAGEKMPSLPTQPSAAERESGGPPREGELAQSPTVVLVAGAEVPFVEAVAKRLSKRNVVVLKAFSGEETLQALAEHRNVDVVVMDVKMPGQDGLETLREIQKRGFLAEVILLSGHTTVESAIDGMKLGAFDYLMKPCDMVQLFSCIEKAKAKKTQREQSLMEDRIRELTLRRM
ncbi:MAG: ATP-binding protein [bacterium]